MVGSAQQQFSWRPWNSCIDFTPPWAEHALSPVKPARAQAGCVAVTNSIWGVYILNGIRGLRVRSSSAQERNYHSLTTGSTPDISPIFQLTIIVWKQVNYKKKLTKSLATMKKPDGIPLLCMENGNVNCLKTATSHMPAPHHHTNH